MPTEITAQDGTKLTQTTIVSKTGCGAVRSFKATRAQKLARALAACRKRYKHRKAKRLACEHKARKQYPTKTKRHKATRR